MIAGFLYRPIAQLYNPKELAIRDFTMNLQSSATIVNVASVRHRSPFRYPGGKTWLVPLIRRWLASVNRPREFYEPFAGGAIVGLSAIFDNLADHLTIVELDDDVAAVWRIIAQGRGEWLARRILSFEVSLESVRQTLDRKPRNPLERAFATIVRNRMQRGGILAAGASLMKSGENGKGLLSRWYPETLAARIRDLCLIRDRFCFVQADALEIMRGNCLQPDCMFFIDPPYTVAGRRLYSHSEVDHERLFRIAAGLRGDFLMTYDNAEPVRELAKRHGFEMATVPMKNTHHAVMSELLIGRNLDWLRD